MALFVALPIPEAVKSLIQHIKIDLAGATLEHPDDWHITLKHSIEADAAGTADLVRDLNSLHAESFAIEPAGLRFFANARTGKPVVIYLEVKPYGPLDALRQSIEAVCSGLGHPAGDRQYTPHVTLCRLPEDAGLRAVEDLCGRPLASPIPSWPANSFRLYESIKRSTPGPAPRYRSLADFEMGF